MIPSVKNLMQSDDSHCRLTVLSSIGALAPVLGQDVTCSALLPSLLSASKDEIPNVKFNVAKVLKEISHLLDRSVIDQSVKTVLVELKEDEDVDVQYYASVALEACEQSA